MRRSRLKAPAKYFLDKLEMMGRVHVMAAWRFLDLRKLCSAVCKMRVETLRNYIQH